jgi:hypothetical protein
MSKTASKKMGTVVLTLAIIVVATLALKAGITSAMQNEENKVVFDETARQMPLVLPEPAEKAAAAEASGEMDVDAISLDDCIITSNEPSNEPPSKDCISREKAIEIAINEVTVFQKKFGGKLENQTLWINYWDNTGIMAGADEDPNIVYPYWQMDVKVLYNIDAADYKNLSDFNTVLDKAALAGALPDSIDYSVNMNALTGEVGYILKSGMTEMDQEIIDNADNRPGITYREMAEQEAREYAKKLFPGLTIHSVALFEASTTEYIDCFRYQISMSDGSDLVCEFTEFYSIKPHDENNDYPPKNENAAFYDEGASSRIVYYPNGRSGWL